MLKLEGPENITKITDLVLSAPIYKYSNQITYIDVGIVNYILLRKSHETISFVLL